MHGDRHRWIDGQTGRLINNDSFSLYIAVSHMAHVLVYYTLLVVIIICICETYKKLENVAKRSEFVHTRE